jgi:hypothetical protein
MAGFDNNTMYADNVDFTGAVNPVATVTTNGQLLIGSTATPNIRVGDLVSTNGTLAIGYNSPDITIDLIGGIPALQRILVDSTTGGTNPVSSLFGIIGITGGQVATGTIGNNVIRTNTAADNNFTIEIQRSTTAAASDVTLNGVSHFDSAQFTVDADGFVSLTGASGFPWTDVTTATQALAVNNGYFTDRGAGVTYTLPATAALGDLIIINGKLGLTTVAQNANQQIRMSSALTTVGVTGSIVATNVGDCVTLRCSTAGASTVWVAESFVGNWTVS